jgi:hypothetical protein
MARPRLAAAVFGAITLFASSRDARADDLSAGKGAAGGAFLGADVVTIVESLVGVHAGWAYGVGALVGAGGGGVGGYLIGKNSSDGKVPTYILAGGLALIIPALVLTFNATRYMPEEGATEDKAPTEPAAEPGAPGGSVTGGAPDVAAPPPPPPPTAPPPANPSPPANPPQSLRPKAPPALPAHGGGGASPAGPALSLVDLSPRALRIGVPVLDVHPTFTPEERRQYGMRDVAELRLPVLHVAF